MFGGKKPEDKTSRWDKIPRKSLIGNIGKVPGAKIRCSVKIDKEFKKQHELSDIDKNDTESLEFKNKLNLNYSEDFIDKNDILSRMSLEEFEHYITYAKTNDGDMQLSDDITDTATWESAKRSGTYWEPTGKSVSAKSAMICGMISCEMPEDLRKFYYIYLDITDWKNNSYVNKYLWLNNSVDPIINIQIRDANTDDLVYSRWYDFANFKQAEPRISKLIQNKLNTVKPL